MPTLLSAKVCPALMPKRCCITVGVITTSTTTAEVSTQVSNAAGINARRCSPSTRRSGNVTGCSWRARKARNTGVSLSQRRSHTPITPNTPPNRNG
ncbi:hypothetical protein D3C72_2109050 [compost metagenome]